MTFQGCSRSSVLGPIEKPVRIHISEQCARQLCSLTVTKGQGEGTCYSAAYHPVCHRSTLSPTSSCPILPSKTVRRRDSLFNT